MPLHAAPSLSVSVQAQLLVHGSMLRQLARLQLLHQNFQNCLANTKTGSSKNRLVEFSRSNLKQGPV